MRELEGELESEQRRHAEAQKTIRRQERRVQELTQLSEDEEKARDAERDTIDKLQSKLKQYKRELDDAVSNCCICPNRDFRPHPPSHAVCIDVAYCCCIVTGVRLPQTSSCRT